MIGTEMFHVLVAIGAMRNEKRGFMLRSWEYTIHK